MTRAAIVLLLLGTTGCSFVFVKGPGTISTCTASNTVPFADAFVAAVFAGLSIAAVAEEDQGIVDPEVILVLTLPITALYTTAAVVGFDKTRRCRKLHGAGEDRSNAGFQPIFDVPRRDRRDEADSQER